MSICKRIKKSLIILPMVGVMFFSAGTVKAELGDTLLKSGTTHGDVQVLQERLIELNFLDINETTTYYGEQTVQAVKDFQSFYGLTADGAFGRNTFETLNQVSTIAPLNINRTLHVNLSGQDVKVLKERLHILGFIHEDYVEENFGPKTKEAVSNFQRAYNLDVDGIAGPETIKTINKVFSGSRRGTRPAATRGRTNSNDSNIVATAKRYIGTPYRFGGTSPSGFDCSGFVQFVYGQHGISVPRTTTSQAGAGTTVSRRDLKAGDLVIFSNTYRAGPSHAGIYIGNGDFIHASSGSNSRGVTISNLNQNYYNSRFSYGRRVY